MAAVGITEKAGTVILEELKKYKDKMDQSASWMAVMNKYAQGIKGSQAVGAVEVALHKSSMAFINQSATCYDFWQHEITDKMTAYKTQDASFATKTTGKKS